MTKKGKNKKDTLITEEDRLWKGSGENRRWKDDGERLVAEEDRSIAAAKMNVVGRILPTR